MSDSTVDDLLARLSNEDRQKLMALCDEYLQNILDHHRVVRHMLAFPESWADTWREGINASPSLQQQERVRAEFVRTFESAEDAKRVFAFLTGRFDV
jgi:hypothetical protein